MVQKMCEMYLPHKVWKWEPFFNIYSQPNYQCSKAALQMSSPHTFHFPLLFLSFKAYFTNGGPHKTRPI